jgi:hypothetical protein
MSSALSSPNLRVNSLMIKDRPSSTRPRSTPVAMPRSTPVAIPVASPIARPF